MMMPHLGLANYFIMQRCNGPIGCSMWTRQLGKHNQAGGPRVLINHDQKGTCRRPFTLFFSLQPTNKRIRKEHHKNRAKIIRRLEIL